MINTSTSLNIRHWTLTALISIGTTLSGCASPKVAQYAAEKPNLVLHDYFSGPLTAYGVFTDRSGHVVKRFTVKMNGEWKEQEGKKVGVLDEQFLYSDGSTSQRVWRLTYQGNGRYTGTADDVVGEAIGESAGNAFNWTYVLKLPVDGREWEVKFDDWMYLMDNKVMLNKAIMSKWGVRLGEVTLSFIKP